MIGIQEFGFRIVQLEVTNRCNMACSFCPLPIRDMPLTDVAPKDVFDLLEAIARIGGVEFVAFHQFGEPLLYPRIWECLDRCRTLGLRSQLVTNGLLLTDAHIAQLLAHPPNILRISAQTLEPEYHHSTRGVEVPFDTYIARLARCVARLIDDNPGIDEIRTDLAVNDDRHYGLHGKVHYLAQVVGVADRGDPTIHSQTPKSLRPHLIAFLERVEKEAHSFRCSPAHVDQCIDRYYSPDGARHRWETAYQFSDMHSITYKTFINGRRISQNHPVHRSTCDTDIIGILANGTVTCCCLDYQGFTGLGNIFTEDLISILRRNQGILEGLHTTGRLHFDGCKKCLGAPTKLGATLRNAVNLVRYP